MTEEFLNYVWKYRMKTDQYYRCTDGSEVKIQYAGDRNYDQGPDFKDARLLINGILWAGNIEVHVKSSDYIRHGHTGDKLYETIILHVVYEEDVKVGEAVCIELKDHINPSEVEKYNAFISSLDWLACGSELSSVDKIISKAWLARMTFERLELKSNTILRLYEHTRHSWEETLYIMIARSYGFKVNAEPFEALARKVPYLFIRKHRDQRIHIESLLYGMAGLLEDHFEEPYPRMLQNEFKAIGKKLDSLPLHAHYWRYHRMRPSNFPDLRIAQLASVLWKEPNLCSLVLETTDIDEMLNRLSVIPSGYWNDHYRLGQKVNPHGGMIGKESCVGILINSVIPFLFFYGRMKNEESHVEKALSWLELLPSEKNKLVRRYGFLGLSSTSASDSQGLIQLEKAYCSKRMCLDCVIGRKLIHKAK